MRAALACVWLGSLMSRGENSKFREQRQETDDRCNSAGYRGQDKTLGREMRYSLAQGRQINLHCGCIGSHRFQVGFNPSDIVFNIANMCFKNSYTCFHVVKSASSA